MDQIVRVSLVDTVVERLRSEICGGQWPIGTKIPTETSLAHTLGVSRPSVREALRSLVQLGLLQTRQGDGTYVVATDETVVAIQHAVDTAADEDVHGVRRALFVLAAREAAKRRSATDIEGIRTALQEQAAAITRGDVITFISHEVAFQFRIVRAAQNSLLSAFYRSFEGALRQSLARANSGAVLSTDSTPCKLRRQLMQAIERRDPTDAARNAAGIIAEHERRLFAAQG